MKTQKLPLAVKISEYKEGTLRWIADTWELNPHFTPGEMIWCLLHKVSYNKIMQAVLKYDLTLQN